MPAQRHIEMAGSLGRSLAVARPGFTIIELLLALVLLDIGLLALVGLGTAITRNAGVIRASSLAVNVAWGRVERMASTNCIGSVAGTENSSRGIAEWFSDTPTPNETRTLAESVTVLLPHGIHRVVARTRARC